MRLPRAMVVPRRRRRAFVTTRVDAFCAGTRRAGSPRGVVSVAPVATEQDSWNLALPRRATRGRFGGVGCRASGSGWVYFSLGALGNSKLKKRVSLGAFLSSFWRLRIAICAQLQ